MTRTIAEAAEYDLTAGRRGMRHPAPSLRVLHEQLEDRLEVIVGQLLQFLVGPVLHRVRHEHIGGIGAKRLGLHRGGIDKLGGGDTDGWNAAGFEIREVMRTARRAGASVRESFDNHIHLAHDLPP